MTCEKPLIHIHNLTVGYGNKTVIEDVDFKIFENDFVGVIGPNGGGKTTLLKAILGLVPVRSGKIYFREDLPKVKRPIGYLPQIKHIDRQFPITVLDVVRSGSLMRTVPFKNAREECDAALILLDETGVLDLQKKTIGELSGGEMQRVFLCRALISDPKVLLLDEPDAYVDNLFEDELYKRLRTLNRKMAILLVSHDVSAISGYVKTVVFINRRMYYQTSDLNTLKNLSDFKFREQITGREDDFPERHKKD
ncbi:MAG: ABC transporter ATP-binding protein, partial [Prolixibacteraceae bacterium]|nr:ABC transporter ATP-binding protein [Prolixibacteraceae bacterium]